MQFKYFGAVTKIGDDIKLNRLGQSVTLDESLARDVLLGGGAILPAAEFDAIFSPADCANYPTPAEIVKAPIDFLRKREKAEDLRRQLIGSLSPAEPHPGVPAEPSPQLPLELTNG